MDRTRQGKPLTESALDRCKREHPDHWGLHYGQSCDECWEAFRAEFSTTWDASNFRRSIDERDDLAHKIREAWKAPSVIRYDTDDEWRMAVAAADVFLGRRG